MPAARVTFHVLVQILGALLEGHEDPGIMKVDCTVDEELHAEDGFAAAWSAADEVGRPFGRSPSVISSSPRIPVGVFSMACRFSDREFGIEDSFVREGKGLCGFQSVRDEVEKATKEAKYCPIIRGALFSKNSDGRHVDGFVRAAIGLRVGAHLEACINLQTETDCCHLFDGLVCVNSAAGIIFGKRGLTNGRQTATRNDSHGRES